MLNAVLERGTKAGNPRLQLGALSAFADLAELLGKWDEVADWAQRMCVVAQSCGARPRVGQAFYRLGKSAARSNAWTEAQGWIDQALAIHRADGDRISEARCLRMLGEVQLAQGDVLAARGLLSQASTAFEALDQRATAGVAAARAALCMVRLGQPKEALSAVDKLLLQLGPDAKADESPAIDLMWSCQQVLAAVGDPRAGPMLEQLHADVQAKAAQRTDATDRERLIQAIPDFRDIVAAWSAMAATRSA